MPDNANEFVETIKRAALEATEAKKPVNICFGNVVSVSPLKINVEQRMQLSNKQLILSRNVTDFKIKISGGNIQNYYHTGATENSGTAPVSPPHVHAVGKIEITVHNGLAVGDEVILCRQQEGQKFIVLDKVGT